MLRYPSAKSSRLALTTHGEGRYGSTAMLSRSLSTGHSTQLAAPLRVLLVLHPLRAKLRIPRSEQDADADADADRCR